MSRLNHKNPLPPLQTTSLAARVRPTVVLVNPVVRAAQAEVEASDADSVRAVKSPFGSAALEWTPLSPSPLGCPLEKVNANEYRQLGQSETVVSNGSSQSIPRLQGLSYSPFAGKSFYHCFEREFLLFDLPDQMFQI